MCAQGISVRVCMHALVTRVGYVVGASVGDADGAGVGVGVVGVLQPSRSANLSVHMPTVLAQKFRNAYRACVN